MTTSVQGVRCVVACDQCRRQFDASGFAAGSRFHCACGEVIEVPRFQGHDAAVVRCSSCSAPRVKGAESCSHCGADYTLHERDMHTLCPSCMTRVSDRARYCHHCATPIVVQGSAGQPTRKPCPACGRKHKLNGRSLGQAEVAVLECPGCAGLWLSAEAFKAVADRARDESVADPAVLVGEADAPATPARSGAPAFYRQCPECKSMMNRRNFGRRSGVVIDACKEHGMWFDALELGAILRWIRQGGEERATQRRQDEEREEQRKSRIRIERPTQFDQLHEARLGRGSERDSLGGLFGMLFDL
jgi:Zn-finger nucleic acid-binding protein